MGFQNWRMAPGPDLKRLPQAQNVVGAGFSDAAAGPLSGFMGFQNWRMAPCPDLKGFPRPKMSLELALAMLRLAPWLVLWGFKTDVRLAPSLVLWDFKTDGWPPVPISKASPGPKCRSSWLSRCCGWPPLLFYGISKLTDGPLSRSQRLPQAQNVVGAGFSHAAAGTLAGFMGFQNWRMAPGPDPKGFPRPKMSLELALAMLRLAPSRRTSSLASCLFPNPSWFYEISKLTDGLLSRSQRLPQAQGATEVSRGADDSAVRQFFDALGWRFGWKTWMFVMEHKKWKYICSKSSWWFGSKQLTFEFVSINRANQTAFL